MRLNIGLFLAKRAMLDPHKVGLIYHGQRLTYRALNARANRLVHALAGRGLRPGDRLAVLLRNSPEYYDLYFGLAKLGVILVGVNWRLAAPEVAYILRNSGARGLVYGAEFASVVQAVQREVELETLVVVGSENDGHGTPYQTLVDAAPDHEPTVAAGDDDPLALMYTSGTTGYPKGALITHSQMFWTSATCMYTLDYRPNDVNLSPMPLYHIGGLSLTTVFVQRGSTVALLAAWDPDVALATIQRERVNHFMAVPTMLNSLLRHPQIDQTDLSSVRWLLVSAAPVPPDLIRACAERHVLVLQSYGMTETAGPATVLNADHALTKAGSAGLPFFHTEVRIVTPEGRETGPGEVGEIRVRGPHVIREYWQNPTASAAAFDQGWLKTGDAAIRDEDGFIFVVDRLKDMIISGGENIYPAEVEKVLYGHPKIAEVAVIGVPDAQWGEAVCAVVVPRDGQGLTLEEVRDFCAGQLARFKLPRHLILSPTPLPRNPTGKLLKHILRTSVTP